MTPLHCAAGKGHAECIKLLVAESPSMIDNIDNSTYTALHHAAKNDHAEAFEALLEVGRSCWTERR